MKMNEDLSKIRQRISQLSKRRQMLENKIMNTGDILKASYYERFIVCGKPNCKCMHGEKHGPIPWITCKKETKTVSTSVPSNNVARAKEMTENYKTFRNAQKEIKKINNEINELIQEILKIKEGDIDEIIKK